MTKQHRIAGIVLTLIGLYVSIYSFTKLEVGNMNKPGSGFFTLVCGLGILILSASWLGLNWKKGRDSTAFWEKGQWIKPVQAVAVAFVYALAMIPFGYILSTALFIILWQVIIERSKPSTIAIFAVLGTGSMYILFEKLLSVPLPNGPLPW